METTIFLLGAAGTAIAVLVSNLMTGRPETWRDHVKALARFGIFTACVASAARVLQTGTEVTWERALLMVSLFALYAAQVRIEAVRQSKADTVDDKDDDTDGAAA